MHDTNMEMFMRGSGWSISVRQKGMQLVNKYVFINGRQRGRSNNRGWRLREIEREEEEEEGAN